MASLTAGGDRPRFGDELVLPSGEAFQSDGVVGDTSSLWTRTRARRWVLPGQRAKKSRSATAFEQLQQPLQGDADCLAAHFLAIPG